MPEVEPGFLSAASIAAELAGFDLDGMALRLEQGLALARWSARKMTSAKQHPGRQKNETQSHIIKEAGINILQQYGSPVNYLYLHTAAISALAENRLLVGQEKTTATEAFSQAHNLIQTVYAQSDSLTRFDGSSHSLEVGQWWLAKDHQRHDPNNINQPLADRIEVSMVNFIINYPGKTFHELDREMCRLFPGLLTPKKVLLELCLESYAEEKSGGWYLRHQDDPKTRRKDLESIRSQLAQIGEGLEYTVQGIQPETINIELDNKDQKQKIPLSWIDEDGVIKYEFYITVSAVVGKILYFGQHTRQETKKYIAIPGSRARLVHHKLRQDKRLNQWIIENEWGFVKFRQIRQLANASSLDRRTFIEQLERDPLENTDPQLILF
jgi:hypothetical protein